MICLQSVIVSMAYFLCREWHKFIRNNVKTDKNRVKSSLAIVTNIQHFALHIDYFMIYVYNI